MKLDPRTPVLVGVGQSLDRIDSPDYHRWSAADLGAAAAKLALANTGAPEKVRLALDAIATTRTFEDSRGVVAPFGKSTNFPRSIASRLGVSPPDAIWSKAGGNSPQDLVTEFCGRIASGEYNAVLICGAESISTIRHAQKHGLQLQFAENPDGSVDDRGPGLEDFVDPLVVRHGVSTAALAYGLLENARRFRSGRSREAYAEGMGRLFAPFAAVAHANRRAAYDVPRYTPQDLIAPGPRNRWIASPYPARLIARDQVNLGAALILMSLGAARRLGISEDHFVYVHGAARALERHLLYRPDLFTSPAAQEVARATIDQAGIKVEQISKFDFYSCFPIAVSTIALDALKLEPDDPRRLTVTGGLPYFGGPGNNYSMHAIAQMVEILRGRPNEYGLVTANGGYLSKHSAAVYSTRPCEWREPIYGKLRAGLDATPGRAVRESFNGIGRIETFTVGYKQGIPDLAIVIGTSSDGARFIARTGEGDIATVTSLLEADCYDRECRVVSAECNTFTLI